jgi:hypothetical protein
MVTKQAPGSAPRSGDPAENSVTGPGVRVIVYTAAAGMIASAFVPRKPSVTNARLSRIAAH